MLSSPILLCLSTTHGFSSTHLRPFFFFFLLMDNAFSWLVGYLKAFNKFSFLLFATHTKQKTERRRRWFMFEFYSFYNRKKGWILEKLSLVPPHHNTRHIFPKKNFFKQELKLFNTLSTWHCSQFTYGWHKNHSQNWKLPSISNKHRRRHTKSPRKHKKSWKQWWKC